MTHAGGRPPKPRLELIEVAAAMTALEGKKQSAEAVAWEISKARSSHYTTPELRKREQVSAKWVIGQLADLAQKHGETQITEKLRKLIKRELARRNSAIGAILDPEWHQQPETSGVVARANSQQAGKPVVKEEVAAGGKA